MELLEECGLSTKHSVLCGLSSSVVSNLPGSLGNPFGSTLGLVHFTIGFGLSRLRFESANEKRRDSV